MSTTTKDIWLAWSREGARARARAGVVCNRTDELSAASADVFYQEVAVLAMSGGSALVAVNALLLTRTTLGGTK